MSIWGFLGERFDEEEHHARACAEVYPTPWDVNDRGHSATLTADEPYFLTIVSIEQDVLEHRDSPPDWLGDALQHIARWAPDRVLADVAAKRAILTDHHGEPEGAWSNAALGCANCLQYFSWGPEVVEGACETLKALALPYADHPDFREEWRTADAAAEPCEPRLPDPGRGRER